jgi:hypothetical protein
MKSIPHVSVAIFLAAAALGIAKSTVGFAAPPTPPSWTVPTSEKQAEERVKETEAYWEYYKTTQPESWLESVELWGEYFEEYAESVNWPTFPPPPPKTTPGSPPNGTGS